MKAVDKWPKSGVREKPHQVSEMERLSETSRSSVIFTCSCLMLDASCAELWNMALDKRSQGHQKYEGSSSYDDECPEQILCQIDL